MEAFWRGLGATLGRRWKLVVAAVLAVTAALAIGLAGVRFATGQDSYLNPGSQVAIDNVEFQETFGGEAVVMLLTAQDPATTDVSDLFEGHDLEELRRLDAELAEVPDVAQVLTPLTTVTYSDALVNGPGQAALLAAPARDADGAAARNADIGVGLARLAAIPREERTLDPSVGGPQPNPDWIDVLVFGNDGFAVVDGRAVPPPGAERAIRLSLASSFPDQHTAVGAVVLGGNLDLDAQGAATDAVLDILHSASFEGFDLTVTGSPVYLKEINDYLKGGMLTLGAVAVAVMAVVLAALFRVRWRLLPLLAVVFGALWTFSIVGLVGIDLSLVTISGLPILIGLGIDFAIQVHNRVEEEVVLDLDRHPIGETVANLAPPLIAATLTGVAAFCALQLSRVPMIRDFGVLLAIGVVALVVAGIVVPATVLGIRERARPTRRRSGSWVETVVVKLGSMPARAGIVLVLVSIGLFVGGVLVEGRTRIESDPVRWIDQGSDVVADVDRLEDETGFSTTLGVLVEAGNVFDQDVVDLIHDFTVASEGRPDGAVVASSSFVGTMAKIIEIPGATAIPPTSADVVAAADAAREVAPDIYRALVNEDHTAAQINFRLAPASLEQRAGLVHELQADLDARIAALEDRLDPGSVLLEGLPAGQPSVHATPAGLATVGIGLLENLSANRAALTYFALCIAALFLVLRLRSLTRAVLAMVPVFLGVGASTLIVGLLDIQLSPLTTVSGPLIIASCTEFSVLILGRYLEERQDGLDAPTACDTAAARTGRAFFTSAVTTIGGFAVLIVSPLPLLRDFGVIVTLNVAIALLAALVMMPPLMVWADQRGWLGLAPQIDPGRSVRLAAELPGDQTLLAAAGAVALVAGAVAVYATADTSDGSASEVSFAPVPLPTTTTTSTTTTTTTTLPPGVTTTAPAGPSGPAVDPSGFPVERPGTAIAGVLFDLLTAQGVAPNVANCAISTAYETASEEQLTQMGIAAGNPEALAIVTQGALDCGIPQATVDAAIASFFG